LSAANPLVAAPIDTATPFSGAGLLDSGSQLVAAIESGNWAEGTLAGVGVALDTAATVVDPLGSLIGAGLGWLIDHLEPLKGWFNDFTGDAGEVAAFGQTWANIQSQLQTSGEELARIVGDVDELAGEAMDAYRRFQSESAQHLSAAASWAGAMSTGLQIASTIVQVVHDLVRDVLSQLVGSIISWAAEAIFTLGLATPVIIGQVTTRVASLSAKVGKTVIDAVTSCKALAKLLDELTALLRQAGSLFDSVLKGAKSAAHNAQENVAGLPGIRRLDPRRNELIDNMDDWANNAGIPGYRPFGGLTGQQFIDTHLRQFTPEGYPDWRWPGDNGFGGTPQPHGLGVGDHIDRISPAGGDGKFASPPGTGFSERALPPDRLSPPFTTSTYEVLKPLPPEVVRGPIAGAFEQTGGGTQFYFPKGIEWYIRHGYLG
jgi:hypothetical protein